MCLWQLGYIKQILCSVQTLYVRYCANLLLLYQALKNAMHSGFSFTSFCNFYDSLTDTEMNFKTFRGSYTEQFTTGCFKQEITSYISHCSYYKPAVVFMAFKTNYLYI
jgi:hypothetical protein